MIKKLSILFITIAFSTLAKAQFEEGKMYAGASLTGLNLNYNGENGFNLGLQAQAGYFLYDDVMFLGQVSYEHNGSRAVADHFMAGAGARYYIVQNGLYFGANAKFIHANHNYNDIMPGVEIGYSFFISRTATIEPAVYYDQSFRRHSDYSTIGLRIGFGLYLFKD